MHTVSPPPDSDPPPPVPYFRALKPHWPLIDAVAAYLGLPPAA